MKEIGINISTLLENESSERAFFNLLKHNNVKWRQPGTDLSYIKVLLFDKNDITNWESMKRQFPEIKEYKQKENEYN